MEREKVLEVINYAQSLGVHPLEIEAYYKIWFNRQVKSWLDPAHKPLWYLFDDGSSASDPVDKKTICGVWINDHVLISPDNMLLPNSYSMAKEIAFSQKAGPFMFNLAYFEHLSPIYKKQEQLKIALARIGQDFTLKQKTLWSANTIVNSRGETSGMCTCDGFSVLYKDIEKEKCSALFTIDFSLF